MAQNNRNGPIHTLCPHCPPTGAVVEGKPAVNPNTGNPGGITTFLYDKGCSKNRPIEGAETICTRTPLSCNIFTAPTKVETSDPLATNTTSGILALSSIYKRLSLLVMHCYNDCPKPTVNRGHLDGKESMPSVYPYSP